MPVKLTQFVSLVHYVEDDPRTKDIRLCVVTFVVQHLGSDVANGAAALGFGTVGPEKGGESEVGDLEGGVIIARSRAARGGYERRRFSGLRSRWMMWCS